MKYIISVPNGTYEAVSESDFNQTLTDLDYEDIPVLKVTTECDLFLFSGRHEMPTWIDGVIFKDAVENPSNLEEIRESAKSGLLPWISGMGIDHVNIYVTGLTPALIESINLCHKYGTKVTLYHFNRETGKYFPQEVERW